MRKFLFTVSILTLCLPCFADSWVNTQQVGKQGLYVDDGAGAPVVLTSAAFGGSSTPGTTVSGRKAVTVAGTAEKLLASATACKKVQVCADLGNTNPVVVGSAAVLAADGSQNGVVLVPGNAPVDISINDVSKLYVNAQTNGDAVCFVYYQ